MKQLITLLIITSFAFSACSKVPLSGRKQFSIVPESMLVPMSVDSYGQFLSSNKVLKSGKEVTEVKEVGRKLSGAVNNYFRQKKQVDRLKNFDWEFNVIEDEQVNAWCMPGGKVVFYTGILPITQTKDGIAVVMGHEVSHAVAKHGAERMSQGLVQQLGGIGLAIALREKPQQTQNLFMQAYGLGSTLGVLAFSRNQEKEADHLGLIFMAMAGYNPQESVPFWTRMSANSGGQEPPEFLSTHPNHDTRIKNLKSLIPSAMKFYRPK